jgi:hypothetical protein
MDAAWTRVLDGFEHVRAGLSDTARASAELEPSVEHCRRLYAVACSVLARRREELGHARSALAGARQRLRALGREPLSGGSCDVRG